MGPDGGPATPDRQIRLQGGAYTLNQAASETRGGVTREGVRPGQTG